MNITFLLTLLKLSAQPLKIFPAEVPEFLQHALQRAQALGIAPQAESQQQHLNLPPRVLRLQQYGSGAGNFSAFVLLPAPKSLSITHCKRHVTPTGQLIAFQR